MEKICDDKKCTGCMACYNICPMNAISMTYNERTELSVLQTKMLTLQNQKKSMLVGILMKKKEKLVVLVQ